MRSLKYVMLLAVLLAPTLAEAQHSKGRRKTDGRTVYVTRSRAPDCCWGNRFSLEPYGGAIRDAYDSSPDGQDTGFLVGFRVGYQLSSRSRLLGNVGYSETDNVHPQGTLNLPVYDNNWVFTTAGAEFDVVPGRTSASLGLQAGAAFRKTELDGETAPLPGANDEAGFSAQEVLLPALVLRHRLTQRATFSAGLHDYIFDFLEGPAKHSLALTAGIAFR